MSALDFFVMSVRTLEVKGFLSNIISEVAGRKKKNQIIINSVFQKKIVKIKPYTAYCLHTFNNH